MKTSIFLVLALCLALSCDRLDPDITVRHGATFPNHDNGRPPRGASDSTGGPVVIPPDGLFVTAVAYPEGYDWRRDTARGDIRGRLLLLRMRDGAAGCDTVLSLEAGAGRPVSLDPDRHQFAGGHLYTQCITEAGTVYRRDGRTVLLSQEREYLRGILVMDDGAGTLYTLSQRLDGDGGFVLRRNWKPVLTREGGRIHGSFGESSFGPTGALFADGGQACFFYEQDSSDWILVRAGNGSTSPDSPGREVQEIPVTLPDGITRLYDLRCHNGTLYFVCRWKQREPVLYIGSKKYDLSATLPTPGQKSGFRLIPSDDGIRISGTVRLSYNQRLCTGLWSENSLVKLIDGRCDWLDPETFLRKENGRITGAGIDEKYYSLSGSGTLMMPSCAYRNGHDLYLALTGSGNVGAVSYPALWINGQSIPLPLNGFLSSVVLLQQ